MRERERGLMGDVLSSRPDGLQNKTLSENKNKISIEQTKELEISVAKSTCCSYRGPNGDS